MNIIYNKLKSRQKENSEAGISVIEVIVAFVLFGILSAFFIPVLITSIKTTNRNSVIGETSQIINDHTERIRSAGTYKLCGEIISEFADREDVYDNIRNTEVTITTKISARNTDGNIVTLNKNDTCEYKMLIIDIEANAVGNMNFKNPLITSTTEVFLQSEVKK